MKSSPFWASFRPTPMLFMKIVEKLAGKCQFTRQNETRGGKNTKIGRCSNERSLKDASLPHLPILRQYVFTMLLCLMTRHRSVCLLCNLSYNEPRHRPFTLSSSEPCLGIELCSLLAQLELQDMIRADGTKDLPRAYLLSTADAHRSEVAVD